MTNIADREILFSDSRGMSIPWCFATDILEGHVIEGLKAFQHLKAICERHEKWQEAAKEEGYWDAWHDVLNSVVVKDDKEHVYSLEQDGDVFLVPHDKHIQWVPDDEELSDNLLDEMYREMLDSCYEDVNVCNTYTYTTSRVLKEVDPTTYRCGYADWLDSELENKALTEHGGKYYDGELKIPENFFEFMEDMDEYEGHFEWKKVTPAIDYEKGITEIEFEPPTDATVYGRALHTYVFEELMDQHHGHLGYRNREPTEKEWKILHSLGYTDIPAHQTMGDH
jgi:hypothetical protein